MPARPTPISISVALLTMIACSNGGDSTTGPDGGGTTEAHRISISISGLQGTGAIVQLNGANDSTLASGRTTAYYTNVPKGTKYAITVKTQPIQPWQNCVIANGTGTMGTTDVSDVAMTCTTNTYKVQGTIAGLSAGGLAISINNGTASSIPSGSSSFAFPSVPSGPYTVTIASQPAGQTCALNNGSGTVRDADVTNLTITCGTPGFLIGGTISGLGSDGLTLTLNGKDTIAIAATASTFSFPKTVQQGADYDVVITGLPKNQGANFRQSCALARAHGKVGSADVSNIFVACRENSALTAYEGTFYIDLQGRRNYLLLLLDGTFSFASRSDDASCAQNGNGAEYGIYSRTSTGAFSIRTAVMDRNGGCGLWDPQVSPPVGLSGTMVRNGDLLTITTSDGPFVLNAVPSNQASLVGAFVRADGIDGNFIVFEADGTYLYQETQDGGSINYSAGWERGCYTVSGNTFTTSLATSCKPNGLPAVDLNNASGFSSFNGAPIPFTINSATNVTINGKLYRRVVAAG